jgi:hypothetical protein
MLPMVRAWYNTKIPRRNKIVDTVQYGNPVPGQTTVRYGNPVSAPRCSLCLWVSCGSKPVGCEKVRPVPDVWLHGEC